MASPLNYANIVAQCPSSWKLTGTITDTSRTLYINGCSWVARARVSSVLFRSNWVDVTAYYYNGSTWVQAYAPRGNNGHTVYVSGAKTGEWKFYHNRSTEGTTSGDQPLYQMWKFVVQMRGKDGSAHGYFDWWVGGLEKMTEAEYNSYFRYKPIKKIPIVAQLDYGDSAFITSFRPSFWRGDYITSSNVNTCGYSAWD